MYKHECFKIFTRKSIYIVFILVLALIVYAERMPIEFVMTGDVYEDLYEELGGPVTEEKELFVREQMRASDAGESVAYTEEDRIAGHVHFLVSLAGMNLQENLERQNELNEQLDKLSIGSYDYKLAKKELAMLEEVESSYGFYIVQAWHGLFHFIEPFFTVILLSLLLLIACRQSLQMNLRKKQQVSFLQRKTGNENW